MIGRGYDRDFAERTFKQLEGFGSYGFPESHAASFALIAYASSWMKCHHPEVFCCAILNAQPHGLLCAGAAGAGCPPARGRGPTGGRQPLALGLHAGAGPGRPAGGAARAAAGPGPGQPGGRPGAARPRGWPVHVGRGGLAAQRGCPPARSSGWPMRTRSARSA